MAAARDQAARILRSDPEALRDEPSSRETVSASPEPVRPARAEETVGNVARSPAELPDPPAVEAPSAPTKAGTPSPAKPGKRNRLFLGVIALLALAAAAYGVHYLIVGRFMVSTDDAYVRA